MNRTQAWLKWVVAVVALVALLIIGVHLTVRYLAHGWGDALFGDRGALQAVTLSETDLPSSSEVLVGERAVARLAGKLHVGRPDGLPDLVYLGVFTDQDAADAVFAIENPMGWVRQDLQRDHLLIRIVGRDEARPASPPVGHLWLVGPSAFVPLHPERGAPDP